MELLDNQVGSLRKRWVIGSFQNNQRTGTYWGIGTNIGDYQLADAMNCPFARTMELASTPTRLKAVGQNLKQRLVNWGYAVSDAAVRKHLDSQIAAPQGFPFPAAGI
jgi:NTE family protein